MRNAVKEFLEYTDDEKKQLWDTATFVFDTNILLNLYRYSQATRDRLIEVFEKLENRVWLPNHVAKEYMKNRYDIIIEVENRCEKLEAEAKGFIEKCSASLNLRDGENLDLVNLGNSISTWIEKNTRKRN